MKRVFGFLLFNRLKRDEVLAIAKSHAESKNWPWIDSVFVSIGLFTAHVMTNADYKCGNIHVWISHQPSEVIK